MTKTCAMYVALCIMLAGLILPAQAHAYSALQCSSGQPVAGTSLFDDSSSGACQYTGVEYIFSTIICQFVTMINSIMGKLYCSIQAAAEPIVMAAMTVFVAIYGVQMIMGTAQLSTSEVITRLLKMSLVLWLITDPTFGVSAGISYLFNFFISFISDTTRWVVEVLSQLSGISIPTTSAFDPGITGTFYFLDNWIYNALTGTLSQANAKVIGFFIAMAFVMPSIAMMALYWIYSLIMMMVRTMITFLMAIIAISFLLGLSPIFISFLLFQSTFQYFDQWLRFMISYSVQVMVTFGILTLWIFSMTLFAPFFNELSDVLYPYQKVIRPAAAIYNPANTWGLCPGRIYANPIPHAVCPPGFNPLGPGTAGVPPDGNDDYKSIIPPSKVPELKDFVFYLFYHMISLIIVCYGFSELQKKASSIARQLGGPSYVPVINAQGVGSTSFGSVRGSGQQADRYMSKGMFSHFTRRHEGGQTPYEGMVKGFSNLVSGR